VDVVPKQAKTCPKAETKALIWSFSPDRDEDAIKIVFEYPGKKKKTARRT
jgi:hypothetical protein